MSLIDLLFSRKEVVVSLVVIGLILLIVVMLALIPVLQRSWKKRMLHQRAQKAARLARNKKSKRRNQQRVNTPPGSVRLRPLSFRIPRRSMLRSLFQTSQSVRRL